MKTNGIGTGFNDRQNKKTLPIYLSVCKTVPHSKQEVSVICCLWCHLIFTLRISDRMQFIDKSWMTNLVKLLRKQTELFLLHPSYGCLNRTPSKWKKKLWKETHTIWSKKNQFQLPHRDCVSPHTGTNSKSAISYNDNVSCTMKINTEWMFWGKKYISTFLF